MLPGEQSKIRLFAAPRNPPLSSPLLLGLRSLIFYIGYVSLTIWFGLTGPLLYPLLGFRRCCKYIFLWHLLVIRWLRFCCGVRYRILGSEHVPEGPCVFLSRHQSPWETMFLCCLKPPPTIVVVKRELLWIPIFGWGLLLARQIPIDRRSSQRALQQILERGSARIKKGFSVLIFPEGTRVPPGQMRKFSRGGSMLAQTAEVPAVPIAHNAGECWPAHRFLKYPGEITVSLGQPIPPDAGDAKEINRRAEEWVRAEMEKLPAAKAKAL